MLLLMTAAAGTEISMSLLRSLSVDLSGRLIECKLMTPGPALFDTLSSDVKDPTWDVFVVDVTKGAMQHSLRMIDDVREINKKLPIFVITSGTDACTRSEFLRRGAWDCFSMPFSMEEFISRLEGNTLRSGAYCRHSEKVDTEAIYFGNLKFSRYDHRFYINESMFHITKSDALILKKLLQSKENIVSREQLACSNKSDGALDSQISRLRKRLSQAGADCFIKPSYGSGYRLCLVDCNCD